MNPSRDRRAALARYREGPELLERSIRGLDDEQLDFPPGRGGWTIRQIVHHVVDGDDFWKIGVKAALGNPPGEITLDWYWTLPQETWAERWRYDRRPLETSLALFRAIRSHVAELVAVAPDGWDRTIGFRNRDGTVETISVGFMVEMQADHVDHHVARILEIRRECAGA
jgi:hypothetical protein